MKENLTIGDTELNNGESMNLVTYYMYGDDPKLYRKNLKKYAKLHGKTNLEVECEVLVAVNEILSNMEGRSSLNVPVAIHA